MGTFDELAIDQEVVSAPRAVPEDATDVIIGFGGYTHPLFTDPDYLRDRTPFERMPLPGELVLFLAGGLAEQTGLFDETTIALVGMDDIRFRTPAHAGDELRLHLRVVEKERSASGRRGTVRMAWRVINQHDDEILSALADMLFRLEEDG
jgi:acyl dehydratase